MSLATVKKALSEEWKVETLEDLLVKKEAGKRPKGGVSKYKSGTPSIGGEHLTSDGGFDFSNIKYVPDEFADSMNRGVIELGDFIIVKDGATTGKISLVKESFPFKKAVVNEHVILCNVNERVDNKYIFYYLWSETGKKQILNDFRGAAQGGISQKFSEKVKVPLPTLPTQHRIVEKIEELFSELDNGIENLKKAKQQLETYKQSVLKAAFEGKLTKEWREQQDDLPTPEELKQQIEEERKKYREQQLKEWEQEVEAWKEQGELGRKPRKPRKLPALKDIEADELENLDEIPSSWVWLRTQEVGEWNGGGTPRRSNDEYWDGGIIPWVSPKDMKRKDIATTQDLMTEKALAESSSARMVDKDSILFVTRSGILRRTLPVAIAKNKLTINQDLKALTPAVDISSEYIYWYCKANDFEIRRECSKDGTTVESIKTQAIKNYPIPICSAQEQRQVVEEIESKTSVIHQLTKTIDQELQKAESLRQSVLKKAFEGKLVE